MKYAHKHLMVAGLLAALGLAAGAQTPSPLAPPKQGPGTAQVAPGDGQPDRARMHERMQERMSKRLAGLKQKLQLSPAQESAWTSYAEALKPSGKHQRGDRAEFARLTTPERIDRMRARRTERIAAMDRRGEATKTFYAALTPQQKKVFDDTTARGGDRHGRGHGGHHGQHRKS